jgi:predicted RNA-binding Zn-ribbon protein involved in translation (DUF1610 family)
MTTAKHQVCPIPNCGSPMRRTPNTKENDRLVKHFECPKCGHKMKKRMA